MQVHEIAKATGRENKQVAADLGLDADSPAVHLLKVDDIKATAYIAEHGEGASTEADSEPKVVRYWSSKSRNYSVPSEDTDERGDIRCRGYLFTCEAGGADDKFLRANRSFFIAQQFYRVVEVPYSDPETRADLMDGLRGVIYTGVNEDARTPSVEGRDCVKALLNDEARKRMDSSEINNPKTLIRAVANCVSLDVDSLGQGV